MFQVRHRASQFERVVAYQRHTMPLILPTLAFAAVVTHLCRGQTEEGATG